MHHSVLSYQFMLENLVKMPAVFFEISDRIYINNYIDRSFHYLTPENCHYVRHCLRAICSATTRFNATIDANGDRIPCVKLPAGLHDARFIDTLEDAQLLAIRRYSETYNPNDAWPNITVSLGAHREVC
jgi:hypothetical protein